MKHTALITVLVAIIPVLVACDKQPVEKPIVVAPTMSKMAPPIAPGTPLPPGHPDISGAMSQTATLSGEPAQESDSVQTQSGVVVSSINIPQFTYLEVKQGNQTRWIASATLAVKKGDVINFDDGSTMSNFNSKALNRTFPSITFVNHATVSKRK